MDDTTHARRWLMTFNMRRWNVIALGFAIVLCCAMALASWMRWDEFADLFSQESIPDAQYLREQHGEFIVGEPKLEGLYSYIDTPSWIFKYTLPANAGGKDLVLVQIEESATEGGWVVRKREGSCIRFSASGGNGTNHQCWDARVVVVPQRRTVSVFVCAIVASTYDDTTDIEETREAWYLNHKLLPRFESYIREVARSK